jgi:hypothetical protein
VNFGRGKFFGEAKGGVLDSRVGLLVEGKDDAHLVDFLLDDLGADPTDVKLVFCGGTGEMEKSIASIAKSRPYIVRQLKKFGVIRDADVNPTATWESLGDAFVAAGLPAIPNGQIVGYDEGRSAGAFLIPALDQPGAVEELLLQIVDADPIYNSFLGPFDAASEAAGGLDRRAKRLMQIYLATKHPLCKGGGLGLKAGHFDQNHETLHELRNFLAALIA